MTLVCFGRGPKLLRPLRPPYNPGATRRRGQACLAGPPRSLLLRRSSCLLSSGQERPAKRATVKRKGEGTMSLHSSIASLTSIDVSDPRAIISVRPHCTSYLRNWRPEDPAGLRGLAFRAPDVVLDAATTTSSRPSNSSTPITSSSSELGGQIRSPTTEGPRDSETPPDGPGRGHNRASRTWPHRAPPPVWLHNSRPRIPCSRTSTAGRTAARTRTVELLAVDGAGPRLDRR